MKRIVCLLLLTILLCSAAFAEEVKYTGIWVPVRIEDPNGMYPNLSLPSQWGEKLPEFDLEVDGTVKVLQEDGKEQSGRWEYGPDEGRIRIDLEDGVSYVLEVSNQDLHVPYYFREEELFNLTLKQKEQVDPLGTWVPILQTQGTGDYWEVPQRTATIVLNDDQTGRVLVDDGKNVNERAIQWERNGNDVILYAYGKYDNGSEGYFPFEFYQFKDGLLLKYEQRDENNKITYVYGKQGATDSITEVDSLRPLLNTAWELFAREIKGVRIPLSVYGNTTEEYIMFFSKGNGGLIHIENGEQSSLKCSCMLVDGSLSLNFKGSDPVICQYADSEYLIRKIGEGVKLYYRRKLIPEAMGIPEGETTSLDLSVGIPDNTVVNAGTTIKLSPVFSDSETVNSEKGNDLVIWSVTGTDGNPIDGVTIDDSGKLIIESTMLSPVNVIVHVKSVYYGTESACSLIINPAK